MIINFGKLSKYFSKGKFPKTPLIERVSEEYLNRFGGKINSKTPLYIIERCGAEPNLIAYRGLFDIKAIAQHEVDIFYEVLFADTELKEFLNNNGLLFKDFRLIWSYDSIEVVSDEKAANRLNFRNTRIFLVFFNREQYHLLNLVKPDNLWLSFKFRL